MRRRILAVLLAALMTFGMCTTAGAANNTQLRAADALNHLDLFRGRSAVGEDYDLDGKLNRLEGTVILLRVFGQEGAALKSDLSKNPFADATLETLDWGHHEVTYAYTSGLTKGTSPTTFSPKEAMMDYMFLTFLLRHLGYKDGNDPSESGIDFVWNQPYKLAREVGLITGGADEEFTRGDAVMAAWRAMSATFKGSEKTLADSLIKAGVFNAVEYKEAQEIWQYGMIVSGQVAWGGTGSGSEDDGRGDGELGENQTPWG